MHNHETVKFFEHHFGDVILQTFATLCYVSILENIHNNTVTIISTTSPNFN